MVIKNYHSKVVQQKMLNNSNMEKKPRELLIIRIKN